MVQARLAALKGIALHEWAVRFFFGGAVCVAAGLIARRFGPGIGGLFLAFPAIFPAGASMVEAHEKKHKARAGFDGTDRGPTVAGVDAAGAVLGSIGLAGFALTCWICFPQFSTAATFALAILVWATVSITSWLLSKSRIFRHRRGGKTNLYAFRNSSTVHPPKA
jgi:hypothetical protein